MQRLGLTWRCAAAALRRSWGFMSDDVEFSDSDEEDEVEDAPGGDDKAAGEEEDDDEVRWVPAPF